MDNQKYQHFKYLWGPDHADTQEYNLNDMLTGRPYENALTLEDLFIDYNKQLPKNKQFYSPTSAKLLKNLSLMFNNGEETNSNDYLKYYHPETKFKAASFLPGGVRGAVMRPNKDKNIRGDTVLLNPYNRGDNTTILHEAAHVDSNLAPTQGYFLGEKISPLDSLYFRLMEERKKENEFAKRIIDSGNYNDSVDEIRAELRSSFGRAPRGTTAQQHFRTLVEPLITNKDYYYNTRNLPANARGGSGSITKLTNDNVYSLLEKDLFPRERWIEPRPPTLIEKITDLYTTLFKK